MSSLMIAETKQRLAIGWVTKIYYLELRALEGTLSQSRLHLQVLAPTNPHWACVVSYGLFSSCVIHKEGLCPSGHYYTDHGDDDEILT
jgi:hypothetical protein